MKIVHYAWRYAVPLILLGSALLAWNWYWLGIPVLVVAAWVIWFFRDPDRPIPRDKTAVICPADGKICRIGEVAHPDFPGGRAKHVDIFMNVFNVHVQCGPMNAVVQRVEYRPGSFVNAEWNKASDENECNDLYLKTAHGPLLVRQIAGAVARRIVCNSQRGDRLRRGEKYGLIRFGSRVEVYMPVDFEVTVKVGQRVKNTTTILGHAPAKKEGLR